MEKKFAVRDLHLNFKSYRADMYNIWEEFSFLETTIQDMEKKDFYIDNLVYNITHKKTVKDAGGMRNRFLSGTNQKSHYIDAICRFETYFSTIMNQFYNDFPEKIQPIPEAQLLFGLIIRNSTKEDILKEIIRKKIESTSYNNLGKLLEDYNEILGLGNIFVDSYKNELSYFKGILERRNVLIHKAGKVDGKFKKKYPHVQYEIGNKIIISNEYLKATISLLIGFGAIVTACLIRNIYKGQIRGVLKKSYDSFDRCVNNNFYVNLK